MTGATTWYGRRGTVLLGPTEARVARWLVGMTRSGRITIRTVDVAAATHVERSEAYRILARLRTLGLFGIENDRGGNHGGRRIWRTAIESDAGALDQAKHREAWARILAWSRARRARLQSAIDGLRNHTRSAELGRPSFPGSGPVSGPGPSGPATDHLHGVNAGPDPTFLERLIVGGLSTTLSTDFGRRVQ